MVRSKVILIPPTETTLFLPFWRYSYVRDNRPGPSLFIPHELYAEARYELFHLSPTGSFRLSTTSRVCRSYEAALNALMVAIDASVLSTKVAAALVYQHPEARRGDLNEGDEGYGGEDDEGGGPGVEEGEDEDEMCCEESHGHAGYEGGCSVMYFIRKEDVVAWNSSAREDAAWTLSIALYGKIRLSRGEEKMVQTR
jgi:hypothetical protein